MATAYGLPTCSCVASWLPTFMKVLGKYGIKARVTQLTGTYGPSGGTHRGGGAIDLIISDPGKRSMAAAYALLIKVARLGGADPSWHRRRNWDNAGGIEHAHLTLRSCEHRSASAKAQEGAVDANLNGLANRGRDDGYHPLSKRGWKAGKKWLQKQLVPPRVAYTVYVAQDPGDFTRSPVIVRTGPGHHWPPVLNRDGSPKTLPHGATFTAIASRKTKSGSVWRKGVRGGWVPNRRLRKK